MRRIFLVGSLSGAVALSAVSAAWGCSPNGVVLLVGAQWTEPGGTVTLHGSGFEPNIGPVEIRWDSTGGRELGTATAETFTVSVAVPNDAAGEHFLAVVQRKAEGGVAFHATVPVEVRAAGAPNPTLPPGGGVQFNPALASFPARPSTAPVTAGPAKSAPTAVSSSPTPARLPAPAGTPAATSGPPVAAPVDPGAPALQPVATPDIPAAATPNVPAATTAMPSPGLVGLDDPAALPAPSNLWSGLGAARAPNLLDAALPPPGSGLPVGGLLFGGGALALAMIGVVAGRRRYALSRTTRR